MKILNTKLTLHASGTLRSKPLCDLANKLGAEFISMPIGQWPPLVHLMTTFASGDKIGSEYPIGKLVFCASDAALNDYAGYIKERLIRQTCELVEDQIRDQLDPPKPFVDTGLKFHGEPIFFKTSGSRARDKNLSEQLRATWQNSDPWYLHKFPSL